MEPGRRGQSICALLIYPSLPLVGGKSKLLHLRHRSRVEPRPDRWPDQTLQRGVDAAHPGSHLHRRRGPSDADTGRQLIDSGPRVPEAAQAPGKSGFVDAFLPLRGGLVSQGIAPFS